MTGNNTRWTYLLVDTLSLEVGSTRPVHPNTYWDMNAYLNLSFYSSLCDFVNLLMLLVSSDC